MAVKVGNKIIGEDASEQFALEKKRFNARQSHTKNKPKRNSEDTELNFNMEENL